MTAPNGDRITVQRVTSTVAGEYREWTITVRRSSPAGVGDPLNAMTPGARQLLPDAVRAAFGDWLEGRPLVADGAPLLAGLDFQVGDRKPLFPITEPEPAAPFAGRTAPRRTLPPEAPVRLWNRDYTDHLDVTGRAHGTSINVHGATRIQVRESHANAAGAWLGDHLSRDENVFVAWMDREWSLAGFAERDRVLELDLLPIPKPPRVDAVLGRPGGRGPVPPFSGKTTTPADAPYAGQFPDLQAGDRIAAEHPDGTIREYTYSGDPERPVAEPDLGTMRRALSAALDLDDDRVRAQWQGNHTEPVGTDTPVLTSGNEGYIEPGDDGDCPGIQNLGHGVTFLCTLDEGHTGPHAAHGGDDEMYATWPQEPAAPAAAENDRCTATLNGRRCTKTLGHGTPHEQEPEGGALVTSWIDTAEPERCGATAPDRAGGDELVCGREPGHGVMHIDFNRKAGWPDVPVWPPLPADRAGVDASECTCLVDDNGYHARDCHITLTAVRRPADVDEVLPMPGGPNDRLSQANKACHARRAGSSYVCSLATGHDGEHRAYSSGGHLNAAWPNDVSTTGPLADLYARLDAIHDATSTPCPDCNGEGSIRDRHDGSDMGMDFVCARCNGSGTTDGDDQ